MTEATNTSFGICVEVSNYSGVGERPLDGGSKKQVPAETPKPAADVLHPGSMVFVPSMEIVSLQDTMLWGYGCSEKPVELTGPILGKLVHYQNIVLPDVTGIGGAGISHSVELTS